MSRYCSDLCDLFVCTFDEYSIKLFWIWILEALTSFGYMTNFAATRLTNTNLSHKLGHA